MIDMGRGEIAEMLDMSGQLNQRASGLSADAKQKISLGRGLVLAMPKLMAFLSLVGTAAMLWVGGNIITHGLEVLGWPWLYHEIHHIADIVAGAAGTRVQAPAADPTESSG